MKRADLTEKVLDIKRERGWTWRHICVEIGGVSDTIIVGALLGQMKLVKPVAARAAALFGLSEIEERMLNEVPMRGMPMPPTDPLIYRFYEMVMVNGPAWKALIEEEFGDLLFVMANLARHLKIDPEASLNKGNSKFLRRFAHIEKQLAEDGVALKDAGLERMDALWNEARAADKLRKAER